MRMIGILVLCLVALFLVAGYSTASDRVEVLNRNNVRLQVDNNCHQDVGVVRLQNAYRNTLRAVPINDPVTVIQTDRRGFFGFRRSTTTTIFR